MANPVKLHPAAYVNPTAISFVPITLSGADIDLTDPAGVTGGYSVRAVKIGGTGGNLIITDLLGTQRTIPVAANEVVQCGAQKIFSSGSGTTCTPVGVYL